MNQYIILSLAGSTMDRPVFWKADGAGFTEHVVFAGHYSQEQLDASPEFYNDGYDNLAIPLTDNDLARIGFTSSLNLQLAIERYTKRPLPAQVTEVRITSAPQCEIHGWTMGAIYPTVPADRPTPDENGQQVYVMSTLRHYPVWLGSTEYGLVQPAEVES